MDFSQLVRATKMRTERHRNTEGDIVLTKLFPLFSGSCIYTVLAGLVTQAFCRAAMFPSATVHCWMTSLLAQTVSVFIADLLSQTYAPENIK